MEREPGARPDLKLVPGPEMLDVIYQSGERAKIPVDVIYSIDELIDKGWLTYEQACDVLDVYLQTGMLSDIDKASPEPENPNQLLLF